MCDAGLALLTFKRRRYETMTEAEKAMFIAMRNYRLQPGQMLLLGPLSVAFLTGDHVRAPWVLPGVSAPGGKMLPDLHVIERGEWEAAPPRETVRPAAPKGKTRHDARRR